MASTITLSSLKFVKPQDLSVQLLNPQTADKVTVIDVRDSDYIGGHVKGGIHVPMDQLDVRMPELLRTLKDQDQVVFHCMLSQVRGPKAALAYARAKAAADAKKLKEEERSRGRGEDNQSAEASATTAPTTVNAIQQVCVLEGGFTNWQKSFGENRQLTEGYIRELWDAELF